MDGKMACAKCGSKIVKTTEEELKAIDIKTRDLRIKGEILIYKCTNPECKGFWVWLKELGVWRLLRVIRV